MVYLYICGFCSTEFPQKNLKEFDVCCSASGRAYHISDPSSGAQMWADLINAVLQENRTNSSAPLSDSRPVSGVAQS
jgi:hypothetical protein